VLAACASTPPLLDERTRVDVDAVTVRPTTLAEKGWEIDEAALHQMSVAEGAARGAGQGTLSAANLLGSGSCEGWICGGVALVWLTTLAVGAVVGAVHGAHEADAEAAIRAQQAPLIRSFETVAESLDARVDLNSALVDALLDRAVDRRPADVGDLPVFVLGTATAPRTALLETEIRNIRFVQVNHSDGTPAYSLELFVRYTLAGPSEPQKPYVSFVYARRGPYTLSQWAHDGAEPFRRALTDAYRQLAESIVDDVAFVYRSPAGDDGTTEYALGYFLDPVYPPRIKRAFPVKAHDIGFGFASTYEVADHQPLLRWSAVPHRSKGQVDDWGTVAIAPGSLRYDVRVYGRDGEVARADGLDRPQFRVPEPLPGCAGYFWTFRARFELEGRLRVTDWSGVYNGWEPWNSRYPRFPGIFEDRDEAQVLLDRTLYFHRFWIRRGSRDRCE